MVTHAFSLFLDAYHTQKSAALGQILDHADEAFKVVPPEVYSPAVYVSAWPHYLIIFILPHYPVSSIGRPCLHRTHACTV